MVKLSIIIPVFNNFNFTKSCLDDLSKLDSKTNQIIIVDNGSTDATKDSFSFQMDNLTIIRNESNLGFAKACNIGYSFALGDNVLFLNNDVKVVREFNSWTNNIIENCKGHLTGPTLGFLDKKLNFITELSGTFDYPKIQLSSALSYVSGWCLASDKNTFNKLNLRTKENPEIFSEEFGIAYFEDTDLSFRARELKIPFKAMSLPLTHFGKMTSKNLNTSELYKNAREIFVNKWKNRIKIEE